MRSGFKPNKNLFQVTHKTANLRTQSTHSIFLIHKIIPNKIVSQSKLVWLTDCNVTGLSEHSVIGACMDENSVQSLCKGRMRGAHSQILVNQSRAAQCVCAFMCPTQKRNTHLITIRSEVVSEIQIWRQPSVPNWPTAAALKFGSCARELLAFSV